MSATDSSSTGSTASGKTAKPRVFIVEDDPIISLDIHQSLKSFGFEIAGSADSGEDTLAKLPTSKADVVLMDISLRGKLDGIQTAEQINIAAPLIFLTALSDETTLQRAKLARPYGYLIKPFDPTELRSTIELALMHYAERNTDATRRSSAQPVAVDEEDLRFSSGDLEGRLGIFSQCDFFKGFSPKQLAPLADKCEVRSLEGGQFIALEGEEAPAGFIVVSGRISVTKSNSDGKELILCLLPPGDAFGVCFLLPHFAKIVAARCQIDSRVLWIPRAPFQRFLDAEPQLFNALTNELSHRLVDSFELSMSLAHTKVEMRIIKALLALLPHFGKGTSPKSNEGRIFITRKELADLTGTTPETAIRVTKHLERESLLDLTRPGIIKIINISALKDASVAA
jgi:CRP-like cAMP-binding protein